jgi:lipoate-protein ligase B
VNPSMDRSIETIRLPGFVRYEEALRMQQERRVAVEDGRRGNALFLLEHAPVITLGRSHHLENLLRTPDELREMGIDVCEADRGGDVTCHGPGQLIAYPILNLNLWSPAIRSYLRALEEVLIRQLGLYGLKGERNEGYTGVWVGGAKVAAIGIGVHNWVTFHGTALNVDPDMSHFKLIVPCGIAGKPVTSLKELLGCAPAMQQVMDDFDRVFKAYFETWQESTAANTARGRP